MPVGLAGGGSGAVQVTWCSRGPPGLRRTPGELDLPLCAKGPVPSSVSHAEGLPDIAARAPTGRSCGSLSGRPPSQAVGVNGRPEQSPSNVLLVCSNMHLAENECLGAGSQLSVDSTGNMCVHFVGVGVRVAE